jgi:hypothetical protein
MPSLFENFPYVCIEAILAKKNVLVSSTGGQVEMIHQDHKTEFIFDWENPEDFSLKIMQLLKLNKTNQKKLANTAYKKIYTLCSDKIVLGKKINLYEEAIRENEKRLKRVISDIKNLPTISVIIDFNEAPEYFFETINSILKSNYKQLELIVLYRDKALAERDSSSLQELLSMADPALRLIEYTSGIFPFMQGVTCSLGEYVCHVTSGVFLDVAYFSKAIELFQCNPQTNIVYSWSFEPNLPGVNQYLKLNIPWIFSANGMPYAPIIRKNFLLEKYSDYAHLMDMRDFYITAIKNNCICEVICEILITCVLPYVHDKTYFKNMLAIDMLTKKHSTVFAQNGATCFKLIKITYPGN